MLGPFRVCQKCHGERIVVLVLRHLVVGKIESLSRLLKCSQDAGVSLLLRRQASRPAVLSKKEKENALGVSRKLIARDWKRHFNTTPIQTADDSSQKDGPSIPIDGECVAMSWHGKAIFFYCSSAKCLQGVLAEHIYLCFTSNDRLSPGGQVC